MPLSPELLAAARKYGPSVNKVAKQYGISGAALLAKVVQGESGGSGTAVSSAGARGASQFMPGSRKIAIDKYGVDPWAGPDQAVHGAALHLRGLINGSTGLSGYNPGSSSYPSYILGQKVGDVGAGTSTSSGSPRATPAATTTPVAATSEAPAASPLPEAGSNGAAILASLLTQPRQAASSQLQAPAASARPQFAGAIPMSGGGPAPRADIGALLEAAQTQGGSVPMPAAPTGTDAAPVTASEPAPRPSGTVPLGGSKNAGKGAFKVSGSNPERLQPGLTAFARKVANVYGGTLTGLDGSTHSRLTVNGNVSEHYAGNATDIFTIGGKLAVGARLVKAGRAALIAAGMPRAQALKKTGGLYNVTDKQGVRHQIIFNATGNAVGGNHLDHLHISTRAR